jgi:hypothetical protein
VQKAQEIYYNARKASDKKGCRRMNGDSNLFAFAFPHLIPPTAGKTYIPRWLP